MLAIAAPACASAAANDFPSLPVRVIVLFSPGGAVDDPIEFFKHPPNPDKQFSIMAGISHAGFQQKNYLTGYHLLHAYFTQPEAKYVGPAA